MKYIFIVSLTLIITACGGGGNSSNNYKDLAGSWGPWMSKGEYTAQTYDASYDFEISFSRFGDVAIWEYINGFSAICFGSYALSGANLDAQLKCNDTDDDFYDGGFTAKVDSSTMEITSINLQFLNLDASGLLGVNLYKNETNYWDYEQNIQAGIYEVIGIDNAFIHISESGSINKLTPLTETNADTLCEINGFIKEDPDFGLTVQNSLFNMLIGAHGAVLSVSECNLSEYWAITENSNINQSQRSVILKSGAYWQDSTLVEEIVVYAPGNAISNNGRNSFTLSLHLVCDQLNNPTDYGDFNQVDCAELQ